MAEDELLTLAEIAEITGMNPSTVRLWVTQGRLSATKAGRQWMVRRGDLEAMLSDSPQIGKPRARDQDLAARGDGDERQPAYDIAGVLNEVRRPQ